MIFVDQTLEEGFRIGMVKENMVTLLELLRKLSIDVIDIRVTDWRRSGLSIRNSSSIESIRGKVNATVREVQLSHKLGFKSILISCAPHSGYGLTSQVYNTLRTAQKLEMKVDVAVENASRFSIEEIMILWRDMSDMGIESFVYGDGDSLLDPLSTSRILGSLIDRIPVPIEFHGHNTYGLATANALGAMQAGVTRVATAVAGVGVKGHAAVEELIMARKRLLGEATGDTGQLSPLCSQILSFIGVAVPRTKAIIGQDIFAHESGIHVDGVVKNPELYEAFPPEEVGLTRKLIMGKHSGTASIQEKFRQWKIGLSTLEAQQVLKQVRKLSVAQKRQVDDEVLLELYQSIAGGQKG